MDSESINSFVKEIGARRLCLIKSAAADAEAVCRKVFCSYFAKDAYVVLQELPSFICQDIKTLTKDKATPYAASVFNTHLLGTNLLRKGIDLVFEDLGKSFHKRYEGFVLCAVNKQSGADVDDFLDKLPELSQAKLELLDAHTSESEEILSTDFLQKLIDDAHRRSDSTQVIASYARCHPAVLQLLYPGLKESSDFKQAAANYVGGFGFYFVIKLRSETRATEAGELITKDLCILRDRDNTELIVQVLSPDAKNSILALENYLNNLL